MPDMQKEAKGAHVSQKLITNTRQTPSWGIRHLLQVLQACLLASLQLCLTLCDPTDCNLPAALVHGSLQARIFLALQGVLVKEAARISEKPVLDKATRRASLVVHW